MRDKMLENIINSIKEKSRKLGPIASAAVLASSLLLPTSVKAATNRVPSQYATIQQAVDNSINGDIVLIADGTYSVPVTNGITWNASEKHLTVKSENGPKNCIIDCIHKTPYGAFFYGIFIFFLNSQNLIILRKPSGYHLLFLLLFILPICCRNTLLMLKGFKF